MVYLEATSLGNIRGECFFLGGDEEDGEDVMMFIPLWSSSTVMKFYVHKLNIRSMLLEFLKLLC